MATAVATQGSVAFWRDLFTNWPEGRARSGLLITAWQETIPFCDYRITDEVMFADRPQPDGQGARKAIVPFDQIVALKFKEVFELDAFASAGFR